MRSAECNGSAARTWADLNVPVARRSLTTKPNSTASRRKSKQGQAMHALGTHSGQAMHAISVPAAVRHTSCASPVPVSQQRIACPGVWCQQRIACPAGGAAGGAAGGDNCLSLWCWCWSTSRAACFCEGNATIVSERAAVLDHLRTRRKAGGQGCNFRLRKSRQTEITATCGSCHGRR